VWAALRYRWSVTGIGILAVLVGIGLAFRLGASFIPRLYEESIVINTVRLAGVALDESVRYGTGIEQTLLRKYPDEIREVWSRTGTAEVATDPMGMELTDVFITLKPRSEWTRARTQAELTELMAAELATLPGMRMIFTQPIEMRMNEMIAGIRADVGVKIFGDDLDRLKTVARQVQEVLESIPGSADVITEQITGQPVLQINVDQDAIARYGVPAEHVIQMVEALGGIEVGEIREGQRRFPLVVKLAEACRQDPDTVGDLVVRTVAGERIPLERLAELEQTEGPSTINREWQKRRIVVQCNVRGRDLHGFVEESRERIANDVTLPAGTFVTFGGQFEHLERAGTRLMIIVPLALGIIFVLLYFSTRSIRDALVVFTGAPFAAVGGILALWIRDMEFTISAGVGFVAVSGVSMLAGLVLVATIRRKIAEGMDVTQAIGETRLLRLRAILMTALVASLGFVPMALNTGVGAEVQRPLATVVIGGLLVDNTLTLVILPALYSLFGSKDPERIRREEAA
jgi:cobalt-zinc-cadmium resistance protein CzcA